MTAFLSTPWTSLRPPGFTLLRGPVLVPGRTTCSGTGPIVGATDPRAAGGGQATWVDFRHRGRRA